MVPKCTKLDGCDSREAGMDCNFEAGEGNKDVHRNRDKDMYTSPL